MSIFRAALAQAAPSAFYVETLFTNPVMIHPTRLDFVNDRLRILDAGHQMTFECEVQDCPLSGCRCYPMHAKGLLNTPQGMYTSPNGSWVVADTYNCVIRRFDPSPNPSSNVGSVIMGEVGRCVSTSRMHDMSAPNNAIGADELTSTLGTLEPDPLAVHLSHPHGVFATSDLGTVYVADTYAHCFRAIQHASTLNATASIVAGACGTSGYQGGLAAEARFNTVHNVLVSQHRRVLYMGEQYNGAVREFDLLKGNVSTVIGSAAPGFADGARDAALINYVHDLKELDAETLLSVEYATNRLRRVGFREPRIETVAGSGSTEIYADQYRNGPADQALFRCMPGLAIGTDTLWMSEYQNGRIRQLRLHGGPGENRVLQVAALASSTWNSSYVAGLACDGDHQTYWSSGHVDAANVTLSVPKGRAGLHRLTIHFRYAAVGVTVLVNGEVVGDLQGNDEDFAELSFTLPERALQMILAMNGARDTYQSRPIFGVFDISLRDQNLPAWI